MIYIALIAMKRLNQSTKVIKTKEEYHKALRRLDELCSKENLSVEETIELDRELVIDIQIYEEKLFQEYSLQVEE